MKPYMSWPMKADILIKLHVDSVRLKHFDENKNDVSLRLCKDDTRLRLCKDTIDEVHSSKLAKIVS